jgi:hypothetical protein
MEARIFPAVALLTAAVLCQPTLSFGSSARSANFIVEAPTPELADRIAKAAEKFRHDLAIEWIGQPMPNWTRPCPIVAQVAPNLGAGGATSFVFDKLQGRDEVFGWDMKIQGSEERILDSVLPHEVTHTIFASYFRRPLPRWADEGACTTVEHSSERNKQQVMLVNFLRTNKGIAFDKLFAMKDYPPEVLPLYSEGYSLARFLIDQWGRKKFLEFVGEGMQSENWPATLKKQYGFQNLQSLQDAWLDWVKQGSPTLLARNSDEPRVADRSGRPSAEPIFRAQSDDRDTNSRSSSSGRTMISAGAANVPTGNRNSVIAGDSGWSPAPASGLAASTAATNADPSGTRVALNDASPNTTGHSVYDRRPTADMPKPQDNSAGSSTAFSLPEGTTKRQAEFVAQRDPSAGANADHRVLLEWSRPQ